MWVHNRGIFRVRRAVWIWASLLAVGLPACDESSPRDSLGAPAAQDGCAGSKCDHQGEGDEESGDDDRGPPPPDQPYACDATIDDAPRCVGEDSVICHQGPDGPILDVIDCTQFDGCDGGSCSCTEGQTGCWTAPDESVLWTCTGPEPNGAPDGLRRTDCDEACWFHPATREASCVTTEGTREECKAAIEPVAEACFGVPKYQYSLDRCDELRIGDAYMEEAHPRAADLLALIRGCVGTYVEDGDCWEFYVCVQDVHIHLD